MSYGLYVADIYIWWSNIYVHYKLLLIFEQTMPYAINMRVHLAYAVEHMQNSVVLYCGMSTISRITIITLDDTLLDVCLKTMYVMYKCNHHVNFQFIHNEDNTLFNMIVLQSITHYRVLNVIVEFPI